ncbi:MULTISPECIES: aminoglycoside phosphotransferase family protein [unclassified Nocardioides]|uniref:aminoglycoside phosphotransferase family protein n=1 Tax=unclassified Nocardioides TaxID=2615069 RepID=UPI0006F40F22|nr:MULTISPECIES: aminoglycoside phosphotransferase family protein [unclassified Nocardioides]KQY54578.1 aminoglycoside resistance protein [Nocardioides sp. Root140]KRF19675.1 aminoglycoside resistance protein [Nocardioides sp. Soil796]
MNGDVVEIPSGLRAQARLGDAWADWLDALPRLAAEVLAEWDLTLDGPSMHGFCSLVLPVRTVSGLPAVLKLHTDADAEESDHEHLALQHWHGHGAVALLRADPRRRAMLLERLHPEDLTDLWDLEACEVVAGLYRRIHVPALPQLRSLTSFVGRWNDDLSRLPRNAPIPRRLVEQATALGKSFVDDPASTDTLIHGDLHYENVLAGDRQPWLVIDPKPMSGDPHYEVAPMLWNRWDEMVAGGDLRDAVRRRFHTLVDHAELDEERTRDWVVVRMVHNAMWAVQDAERAGGPLTAGDREWITQCVTLAKAVQD